MEVGIFVRLKLSDGHDFNGRLGCVVGKSGKRRHPWRVSLLPHVDDGAALVEVTIGEDKMKRYVEGED